MSDAIEVKFRGRALVWLRDADGSGPLAPPEHIEEGPGGRRLKPVDALFSLAWAHVFADGKIRRLGRVIGRVAELEIGPG